MTGPNIAPVAIYATPVPHCFSTRKEQEGGCRTYSRSKTLTEKQLPVFCALSDKNCGYNQKETSGEDGDLEPSDVEQATGENRNQEG